jgi:hypothetical protein
MPTHDIIDNRSQRLVDHINRILQAENRRLHLINSALPVSNQIHRQTALNGRQSVS